MILCVRFHNLFRSVFLVFFQLTFCCYHLGRKLFTSSTEKLSADQTSATTPGDTQLRPHLASGS